MPSEKILAQKQAVVADLAAKLQNSTAGVLVDYKGITVADDTKLRRELREAGVHYFVVKNTLLERAADQVGFHDLKDHLSGSQRPRGQRERPGCRREDPDQVRR